MSGLRILLGNLSFAIGFTSIGFGFCLDVSAQTVRYVHTDALGSVSAMTDSSRNIIERREYEPYGSSLGAAIDGVGYTGHVMDSQTGLTYMQQRYYDQDLGRFLSVDPVTADGNTGGNFNRYKYAANNPYKFTDPDGRQEMADRFNDQFKRDAENGNSKVWEPFQKPAIAMTAVMVVGPAAVAILPEAGGGSALGVAAVNSARSAAAAAEGAGATGGATTGLVTSSGEVFTGASANAGGPGVATNPIVQGVLDSLSPALRSCFHGGCGEINAASNALNAGVKVEGGVMATVRTVGKEIMEACPSCARVADRLGITVVSP
ncbi:RHS repeat-associated core domain-containing protein [Xanthomonas euvesicatoria]|uniref:RHS repeat-associated core domain-containing protein n=1 Tax=Xanthomonas euvesicatoria TaxID=456327 RepID=UPI0024075AD4|nr:RHS repeat-associated core domain-containing protein [Xanthomonas euvesicatoria]MCC8915284.1 RHS repeat-associated core domain-containing protein [Xanthomonas euvesicatoria]